MSPSSMFVCTAQLINIRKNAITISTVNNRAVQTIIEHGDILPDNKVIVTKGLKKGDVIISEGQTKLRNGLPVLTEREFQQMLMKKKLL